MKRIDREKLSKGLFIAHLRSILSHQFQELREYFESLQFLLKSEEKKISDWKDSETANLSPEEIKQFDEWYGEDYWKFKSSFPAIQRTAIFFTIYSELEDVLKFLCRALAAEIGLDIETNKWRGGILEKVKKYLQKDIGLETTKLETLWNEIIAIRKIRNTIIHNNGWLNNEEKSEIKAIDYIINKKNVTLNDKGDGFYKIELSDAFIFEVIDIFDQLLITLLSSISDWVGSRTA